MIDFNHGSACVYGREEQTTPLPDRVNALIDAALVARNRQQSARNYLGGSRVGEPCARRLVYEFTNVPPDEGKAFGGGILRIFDAGHQFETLSIQWLRLAGFQLRTNKQDGEQFGFMAAGGKLRGHIDGVIVGGPDVGIAWPALWEHKTMNARSWSDLVKHGLQQSKPVYYGQVQLYMAYMSLTVTLFTALNKDTEELYHELVPFDSAEAQSLSDKAVAVLRAAKAGELLPRIAANADFYLCRLCPYATHCWRDA